MSYLVLMRHGTSLWNKLGIWTGKTDIPLDRQGEAEAKKMADKIKDIPIDLIFTSKLARARQTGDIVKKQLGLIQSTIECRALDERDYGIYTGKNKWQVRKEVGWETFERIRRGWDFPISGGENLKQVFNRVVPFFRSRVLPHLTEGRNVLVVAHGNSLRALTTYLLGLTAEEVSRLEFKIGEVHIYRIGKDGQVESRQILGRKLKTHLQIKLQSISR